MERNCKWELVSDLPLTDSGVLRRQFAPSWRLWDNSHWEGLNYISSRDGNQGYNGTPSRRNRTIENYESLNEPGNVKSLDAKLVAEE